MSEYKIIYEPVHGSIKHDGIVLELVETPEVQRLRGIKQLGLAYLTFPGANHTRFEHSIGTSYIAYKIGKAMNLDSDEITILQIAGLLHDIGHGPFSHILDFVLHRINGCVDHMRTTENIITSRWNIISDSEQDRFGKRKRIPDVLEDYSIEPQYVADLICGRIKSNRNRYLTEIIHSSIDADQMDYLMRDSHYTGVSHGMIDLPRLLQTMNIYRNRIVFHRKGISAIEGFYVARALMFSSVYNHKTVRCAEMMLANAIEHIDKNEIENVMRMTDEELIHYLKNYDEYTREIINRLKYRNLFKVAYSRNENELSSEEKQKLLNVSGYEDLISISNMICEKICIPYGKVIVDMPLGGIMAGEPRFNRTDIPILDEKNKIRRLVEMSDLCKVMAQRKTGFPYITILTHEKYKTDVKKFVEKNLFLLIEEKTK